MKLKLKEIIKNKWGWVAALIALILNYIGYMPNWFRLSILSNLFGGYEENIINSQLLFFIIVPIIGFILGLIAEKIYYGIRRRL